MMPYLPRVARELEILFIIIYSVSPHQMPLLGITSKRILSELKASELVLVGQRRAGVDALGLPLRLFELLLHLPPRIGNNFGNGVR